MLVSLTVGKVDAGVAVLLTEDKRLVSNPRHLQVQYTAIADHQLDRIPLHPPPTRYPLRQHRRHQRRPQPARRAHRRPEVLRAAIRDLPNLRHPIALTACAKMSQRHPDQHSARMGSRTAGDG